MRIPDCIRIAGVEYKVCWVDNLNDGSNICYGQIDYNQAKINLNSNKDFSNTQMILTLLHEITHGIFHHFDMEEGYNEKLVDAIARGMYMVLRDNPELTENA